MATSTAVTDVSRHVVIETAERKIFQLPNEETAAELEKNVATLRHVPPAARSLYDIEEHLAAMADSTETVEPEQEQQFLADFAAALTAAANKRDRVGQFFAHCEGQAALAQKEIERLQERKASYERAIDRMEGYVARVIQSLGTDAKGKWQKLEGNTVSFSLRRNPPSVGIVDETAVPAKLKAVPASLSADLWESILDALDVEFRTHVLDVIKRPEWAVSKTLVKAAIEEIVSNWKDVLRDQPSVSTPMVPGAAITAGGLKLLRN